MRFTVLALDYDGTIAHEGCSSRMYAWRSLGFEIVVNCTERLDRMTLPGQVSEGDRRADTDFVLAVDKPQLITGDEEVLHNSADLRFSLLQVAEFKRDRVGAGKGRRRVRNLSQTACNLLILKDGEMSEWFKEHAWKAKRATDTEPHRSVATHTRSAN
jgi:hypothetical protein